MNPTMEIPRSVNVDDAQLSDATSVGRLPDDHREMVSTAVQRLLLRRDRVARQKFSAFGSAG
jgi:hypothetical protein